MNGEILKGYRRISKKSGADRDLCRLDFSEYAEKSFRMIPSPMADELIVFFLGESKELALAVEKLDDVFDLFIGGDHFQGDSVLEVPDWIFLKELVNDWAATEDLSLELISEVMKIILEKGLL